MIAVTASYGHELSPYDEPRWPPKGCDRAIAFTDDRRWFELGWDRPTIERNNREVSPRMRGKAPKAGPHLVGVQDDDVLWLDGSMVRTGKDITSLFELVPKGGVGCFRHRFRDCIYDEAEASLEPGFSRYVNEPIREQVAHYSAMGHPPNHGLWELGLIVWRGAQKQIGAEWLAEMLAWTSQDQLSFVYVCRKHGVTPTELPGNACDNDWYRYGGHLVHE